MLKQIFGGATRAVGAIVVVGALIAIVWFFGVLWQGATRPDRADLEARAATEPMLIASLSRDDLILFDGSVVDLDGLQAGLERALEDEPNSSLLIVFRSDALAARVIEIEEVALAAGISRVGWETRRVGE